ncbi:hypothetical protein RchiOBHm_Chr7g0233301 [Rosa chinensis]|uniref:Uncharacterized protein n=1 Tax=Rosa chinensis TaxID=74649 RepID=A0A2P6PG64_ROSCH|nr:hypothetical protein RchiOBHm_Chr7g0233301 [Rosa chinensis]
MGKIDKRLAPSWLILFILGVACSLVLSLFQKGREVRGVLGGILMLGCTYFVYSV